MSKRLPNWRFEREAWRKGYDIVIGVDEVGRGAFAGPVVAGAVAIPNSQFLVFENIGIDDSKRLRSRQREKLTRLIKEKAAWGIGEVGVASINRDGIAKATARAMRAALRQAAGKLSKSRTFVLVDAFHVKYIPGVGLPNQKAIVKGDQKSISIAAASIIAKVHRDKLMLRLARRYRKYGWGRNKGYGTAVHQKAIRKFGVTRWHRRVYVDHLYR